jgi:DNA-binding response OmpR family regulator
MTKRILVVDDEGHIRQMIRLTLETAGYEVGEAEDGYRGLEEFGDGQAWDVVLLDQRMPGLDGLETLRRMRGKSPAARVIMVTAFASIELAVDAMKLGATDFLRKPMTPEMLRNAVTAALAKPAAALVTPRAAAAEAPAGVSPPPVSRLTLNGFRLWLAPEVPGSRPSTSAERLFVVQHPDGRQQEVRVEIDAEAVGYVERAIRRPLPASSAFWTAQAERTLNNALWNDGRVPVGGKMRLDAARMDRDTLLLASRWRSEQE